MHGDPLKHDPKFLGSRYVTLLWRHIKGLVQPCQGCEVNISMSPCVEVRHGAIAGLRTAQRVISWSFFQNSSMSTHSTQLHERCSQNFCRRLMYGSMSRTSHSENCFTVGAPHKHIYLRQGTDDAVWYGQVNQFAVVTFLSTVRRSHFLFRSLRCLMVCIRSQRSQRIVLSLIGYLSA